MAFEFNHVHLKAPDPEKTANWYVTAFNFEIVRDWVRDSGDRFITCKTHDGVTVNISGARTNETMGDGDADAHWGLEHFGIEVDDLDAEIQRLVGLGAVLKQAPGDVSDRPRTAFIAGPDDTRIEVMQVA